MKCPSYCNIGHLAKLICRLFVSRKKGSRCIYRYSMYIILKLYFFLVLFVWTDRGDFRTLRSMQCFTLNKHCMDRSVRRSPLSVWTHWCFQHLSKDLARWSSGHPALFFLSNSIIIVAIIVIYFGGPGGEISFGFSVYFLGLIKKVVDVSLDFKSCGK